MNNGDYPLGAESDLRAPYNQKSKAKREIEVTVSLSLSKTIKVEVSDYKSYKDGDEEGEYLSYDYSECDLRKAVEDQITLPNNLAEIVFDSKMRDIPDNLKKAISDCKDWCIDDFEVVLEQ